MTKEFIVRRSITMIGDTPHVETFSEQQFIRCRDCKHAVLTYDDEVKYCKFWQGDEDGTYSGDPLYLDGDFYCAAAEERTDEE